MTTPNALHTPLSQQALSLGLAVLVTAGLLAGVLGLAAEDSAALIARQSQATPQAIAAVLVMPRA